jgi:hypothetical protein
MNNERIPVILERLDIMAVRVAAGVSDKTDAEQLMSAIYFLADCALDSEWMDRATWALIGLESAEVAGLLKSLQNNRNYEIRAPVIAELRNIRGAEA